MALLLTYVSILLQFYEHETTGGKKDVRLFIVIMQPRPNYQSQIWPTYQNSLQRRENLRHMPGS